MQRLLSRTTKDRKKPQDLEKQSQDTIQQVDYNKRLEFIQSLFGIKSEDLVYFPGVESYCDYLERDAFQPLMTPNFNLRGSLAACASSLQVSDGWDWCIAVLQAIRSEESDASIHDILCQLEGEAGSPRSSSGQRQEKHRLYLANFGVFCWASLVVRPRLVVEDGVGLNITCLLPDRAKPPKKPACGLRSDKYTRPVVTTFRSFKLQHWGDQLGEHAQNVSGETESLYVTSLNIYSLRYFGHVTIQWVDTVSEHLRFNPANRRLSLFRFPTFCALLAVHEENVSPTIRSISEEFEPLSPEDREQCCVSLAQEIILSYRVLFGQDSKSRKLARNEIYTLKNLHPDQHVDSMLLDLCERGYEYGYLWWKTYDKVLGSYPSDIWPITCRSIEGHLQQADVYSAKEDFPRLGRRLIKLQQFNLRQRPSKLTDLWRDRRNPLQWYTFWAVVLVGGVANILAAFQLLVAIADVVF